MPTLRSHTHLQATQATTQIQSLQKSMPTLTHGQKDNAAKMKDRKTNDKNGQLVTKAKIKRAESGYLKRIATNKLHRNLTVACSEMPASF